jgi:cysteinyl-tRNA synthetase
LSSLRLYNTASASVEEFAPLEAGHARMYTCGPTVHDFAHIGNFRTFLFEDLLRRVLKQHGYRVTQVMNITDVEDRIIKKSAERGLPIDAYTEPYVEAFMEDLDTLEIERAEHYPRATLHIPEMVALIQRLEAGGHTYKADGSHYFRISTFPRYGALARLDVSGLKTGARVDLDEYAKDDPRDFVLWKAKKPGEHSWETPLGPGRPGWHIECSAMSMKYLGESFDIHTGGVDLIFPHHEDEIAQSEAATGRQFARFWMHSEFLSDSMGEKMSKRTGNFTTLRDLLKEGFSPRAIRYALLTGAHYRSKLAFSDNLLKAAEAAIHRLDEFAARLDVGSGPGETTPAIRKQWDEALSDDLNLPVAVGALFKFVGEMNSRLDKEEVSLEERASAHAMLEHANRVLDVLDLPSRELADEVRQLIEDRDAARQRKAYAEADRIRDRLAQMGIQLYDTKVGTRWKRGR